MPSKKRFRPRLWPTLITLPAVIVMLGFGVWQLERRVWKQDLIALRAARTTAPAIALPDAPDLKRLEYRKVKLRGRYLHGKELYLGARSLRSNLGYHVITPFAANDGAVVLVNRGWIPLDRKEPSQRRRGQVAGEIELVGYLRAGGRKGSYTPDNAPAQNFWFYVDIPAMANHVGIRNPRSFYLQAAGEPPPGGWPRPVPVRVDLPNNHLQYAITWLALAVGLLVIYFLYHRRRPD